MVEPDRRFAFREGRFRAALSRWLALHGNRSGLVPIIVYQMAKVGSTAVVDALLHRRLPVFHVHRMNRRHLEAMRAARRARGWLVPPIPHHDRLGMRLYRRVIAPGRPAKIVTLVREPIARNLSSYFEHLDHIWRTPNAHDSIPIDLLCRGFFEQFDHSEPLTWFDDELFPVLGVDVYAYPFPTTNAVTIRTDRYELLLMKTEASDAVKSAALCRFLDVEGIEVGRRNVTRSKRKGERYEEFRRAVRFPRSYLDEMLDARYTRHFYGEAERDVLRRAYLAPERPATDTA